MNINTSIIVVIMLLIISCNTNVNQEQTNKEAKEEIVTKNTETEIFVTQAKFSMMIANTAGTSFLFETSDNKELQVFPDNDLENIKFAYQLRPGSTNHKYYGTTFEIKYQKRKYKTTGGDIVDRFYLLDINKTTNEVDEFEVFWLNFQSIISNDDKDAFMNLCTDNMKASFKNQFSSYEKFVNERMKQEISKTTAQDIEERGENEMLFVYKVIHSPENEFTTNYYSRGFWFKKDDGKWMINDILNAG